MQTNNKESLKKFLNDDRMIEAVHGVLKLQFLKQPRERDVQYLAASWLAKDLFEAAWSELLKLKQEEEREEKPVRNVGL